MEEKSKIKISLLKYSTLICGILLSGWFFYDSQKIDVVGPINDMGIIALKDFIQIMSFTSADRNRSYTSCGTYPLLNDRTNIPPENKKNLPNIGLNSNLLISQANFSLEYIARTMAMNEMAMQTKSSSFLQIDSFIPFYSYLMIEILSVAQSRVFYNHSFINELMNYLQTFAFQVNPQISTNKALSCLPSQHSFLTSGFNKQEDKISFFQLYQLIALRKILITILGQDLYEQSILKGQSYHFLSDSFWTKVFVFFNKKSSFPKQTIPENLALQYLKD